MAPARRRHRARPRRRAWAQHRGASWLELGVYEFNEDAQRFYASLGFATLSRKLSKQLERIQRKHSAA